MRWRPVRSLSTSSSSLFSLSFSSARYNIRGGFGPLYHRVSKKFYQWTKTFVLVDAIKGCNVTAYHTMVRVVESCHCMISNWNTDIPHSRRAENFYTCSISKNVWHTAQTRCSLRQCSITSGLAQCSAQNATWLVFPLTGGAIISRPQWLCPMACRDFNTWSLWGVTSSSI